MGDAQPGQPLQHALQQASNVDTFADDLLAGGDDNGKPVLLLDLDGCVWEGDKLTVRARDALLILREHFRLKAVSNNAVSSRKQYHEKFDKLGLGDIFAVEDIYSSGFACANYLKHFVLPDLPEDSRGLFVIGQPGFEDELREAGLSWTGGSDPKASALLPLQDFSSIKPDPSIGAVVHAFDMHVSLYKYGMAYTLLNANPKTKLILTNADRQVFVGDARAPGEGAWAGLLAGASDEAANPTIVGKPEPLLLHIIRSHVTFNPAKACFIGDRLETDIKFAKNGGMRSLLVLTGSSKPQDLMRTPNEDLPDAVCDSLWAFASVVKRRAEGRRGSSSG